MRFRYWWRQKSGQSKVITVLATLMVLEIGLCFGTPKGVSWYYALFHVRPSGDPFQVLGYMAFQAMICMATGLVLALIAIFWHPGLSSGNRKKENHDR